jgi:prepilin-type N-terminal cleavage/methylation domain-containing protein
MSTFRNTKIRSRQDGFTLIELLVGTVMALLVALAAVTFLISIMHRQPKTTSSADVIGNARNAVEKITNDVRVGESATTLRPSELQVTARCSQVGSNAPGSCEVAYSCFQEPGKTTYECQRSVSGGPPATVVSGLASEEIFCVYPTSELGSECGSEEAGELPKYVGVTVELPNYEESQGNTVLEDGAALHNAPGLLTG